MSDLHDKTMSVNATFCVALSKSHPVRVKNANSVHSLKYAKEPDKLVIARALLKTQWINKPRQVSI